MNKKTLDEIIQRIQEIKFKEKFDMIVAIGRGGIIPACLINQRFNLPLEILVMSYRNDKHEIIHDLPLLLKDVHFEKTGKKILLVDDVTRTGATIRLAKQILSSAKLIKTLVVNGEADYSLYNEKCFKFPWIVT